jgi:MFS family permease
VGSPLYLDVVAPEKLRSTAQGILYMASAGIAGIASNVSAGWLIDRSGIDVLYLICGIGAFTLGALAWWILPGVSSAAEELPPIPVPGDTLA